MEELMRFLQLRPPQTLSAEETKSLGLPLYPDDALSDLAQLIREACCDKEKIAAILSKFSELKGHHIDGVEDLDPFVRQIYEWFDYKAKPIRGQDFELFVDTLRQQKDFDLDSVWVRYADSFLAHVLTHTNNGKACIDYQLLIRILYVIRHGIEGKNGDFKVIIDEVALNDIINRVILFPHGLVKGRCCDCCGDDHGEQAPQGKVVRQKALLAERSKDPCDCKCDDSCKEPSSYCLCLKTYVGELFVVREDLARYEEGDIAHIENILAGEQFVRRYRNLYRTEDTTENETETITNEERDHQVSEKSSLQSEIKNTVDSRINVDAGVTATIKYGEVVTVTPHANVTADFARSKAESIARSYAKEIIDHSISKIQEKVRKLTISKVISELEERTKHGIDNTQQNAGHRSGIYYWVNKVTRAQVFNYGKHMMFDVIVPEPAATYKVLYAKKLEDVKAGSEPEKPTVNNQTLTPALITTNNYGDILSKYAISTTEECQPPNPTTVVQLAFSQNFSEQDSSKSAGFSSNEFKSPQIPEGYKAAYADYDVRTSTGHPANTDPWDEMAVSVNLGSTCICSRQLNEKASGGYLPNYDWVDNGRKPMNGEEGIVSLSVAGFSTLGLSISGTVAVTCDLKPETIEKWRTKIYNLVMTDYNRKLDAYKASQQGDNDHIQIKGRNPFLNREIERNEFKRHVIAILMCNYFNGMGSMMEHVAPCGYPEIDFQKLEKDTPVIQFFEQVFEWKFMNYLFYHSMWARKCKWPELIDEDSGDPLFDKFLMAGAARVQVPVRNGMEEVFNWFLKTGQIWGETGEPPVPGDREYVSMIQELKESKQCDYSDRPGKIQVANGTNTFTLTESVFYYDVVAGAPNLLAIQNDIDREILVNYQLFRILAIAQTNAGDPSTWTITVERQYPGANAIGLMHAVGAKYVGAPWEIKIPTKLVYLRNQADRLPAYPLP